jgi:predicted transposase YdaD
MGGLYMTFQEMLSEEREEGRKEGRKEGQLDERKRWVEGLIEEGLLTEEKALRMAEKLSN